MSLMSHTGSSGVAAAVPRPAVPARNVLSARSDRDAVAGRPTLSVIVSTDDDKRPDRRFIEAVLRLCEGVSAELIVVHASTAPAVRHALDFRWVEVSPGQSTADRRATGFRHAGGQVIVHSQGDLTALGRQLDRLWHTWPRKS